MAFDINAARQAGYSDAEILDYLKPKGFDVEGARKSGYADKEILDHVTGEDSKPSGVAAGVMHGLAGEASGVASTLKSYFGADAPKLDAAAKATEPDNYHSAQVLPQGSHWYDPSTYNYGAIPQAVAEAAPGMATDIGAAKIASHIPLIGKYAGPAAGIASYLLRTRGDAAKNDAVIRTGDKNAQPETQDLTRSALTGAAEAIPQAIGIGRFLPGGKVAQTAGQALMKPAITGLTDAGAGAASSAIGQAGATIGTPGGLKVDPNQVAEAGLTSGLVGTGLSAPKAVPEALTARKYSPFGGDNQQATEALVKRVNDAADGGSLKNVKTSYDALKTADGAVRDELKTAVKPLKSTLDVDTADALKRAGKGDKLTDSDLQNIEANTSPDVAFLARQAHVAALTKGLGDYSGGKFVGGAANAMGKQVRALQAPVGAAVSTGLGYTIGGGHAASLFAYGPETLAAIGGSYAALRLLDRATGRRSPMAALAERFQNPNATTRLPQLPQPAPAPEAPQATSGPTGPNVPFSPGVAGGNAMLATGASPWTSKPEPTPASAAFDPLALPADITKRSKTLMDAMRNVQAMREKSEAKDQVNEVAANSPLVNDAGGLHAIINPQVGKLASAHVSAANALKKLLQQPEQEEAAPQAPAPQQATGIPGASQPNSMADVINATRAAGKISKTKGKVKVEAPPLAPEAEAVTHAPQAEVDAYAPLSDSELFGRGWLDNRFAEHQASQKNGLVDPEAYKDGVVRDRQKRRGIIANLLGDTDADHPDHELAARLLEELHHVRRRVKATGAIKHFTESMTPELRDALRKRMDASFVNSMWNT